MKIGLYNVDSMMPNIAMMKISQYYKWQETVDWCNPLEFSLFDKVYASSIFTYSDKSYINGKIICGGTGFDIKSHLPQKIDDCEQDYSLYPDFTQAIGFLTRGCIRKCPDCFVPEKEGSIKPYRDITDVARDRKEVILFDNNILSCDYGLTQIEKIVDLELKVDFNQGLDARLITDEIAKLLSKVKWLRPLRMACDNMEMIEPVRKAVELLRWHNCRPTRYTIYVMFKDIESAMERVKIIKGIGCNPFVQPYRNVAGDEPVKEHKDFASWVDQKIIFKTIPWEVYKRNR